jgi:hypothetical protein
MAGELPEGPPGEWNRLYKNIWGNDVPTKKRVQQEATGPGGLIGYYPHLRPGQRIRRPFLAKNDRTVDVDAAGAGDLCQSTTEAGAHRRHGSLYTPAELLDRGCRRNSFRFHIRYLEDNAATSTAERVNQGNNPGCGKALRKHPVCSMMITDK